MKNIARSVLVSLRNVFHKLDNRIQGALIGGWWACMSTALAWLVFGLVSSCHRLDNGIHNAPSNQAVYLAGEACTINMGFERTDEEIYNDISFCLLEHVKAKHPELLK